MDRDISFVSDILESALRIHEKTKIIKYSEFEVNLDIQDIVIRRFAIIGEASDDICIENRKIYTYGS